MVRACCTAAPLPMTGRRRDRRGPPHACFSDERRWLRRHLHPTGMRLPGKPLRYARARERGIRPARAGKALPARGATSGRNLQFSACLLWDRPGPPGPLFRKTFLYRLYFPRV